VEGKYMFMYDKRRWPVIVALIAAILVLLAGIPSGGYGFGRRWG